MSAGTPSLEARYWSMIERLPYGVMVHDERGLILFANTPAARLAGVDREDLVGRPVTELLSGPWLASVRERLLGLRDDGDDGARVRKQLTRPDGGVVDVEIAAMPFLAGTHGEVQLVFHDIGREIRAEAARVQIAAQLDLLLAQLPGVLWTTDRAGVVTSSHSHDEDSPRLLPWSGTLNGHPLEIVLGQPEETLVAGAVAQAMRGETVACEIGTGARTASIEIGPLRDGAGQIVGTVGLAVDVTDRRLRERRRRERERLEALARLSGGVAHDFNNILTTILARATVLRMESSSAEAREDLDAMVTATRRGSKVASQLLGFARGGMYRRDAIEASGLVTAAAERARDDATGGVEVRLELAPHRLYVEGDAKQLATILDALTENALAATPRGGCVTLRTLRVELAASDIDYEEGRGDGDGDGALSTGAFVCVEVADTGAGMPAALLERAIEPYFTTRGDGRGLGLSMVYGVVRHHHGVLQLTSEVGAGTQARIYLPLTTLRPPPGTGPRTRPSARPIQPATPAASQGTRGTVLVVDDEELVRSASRRLLNHLGYSVTEADDGPSALALFEEEGLAPFAFVLLDLRMPQMGGDEVLRRLVKLDPDVRVIICTGFDRDQVTQQLFGLGHVGFLRKPFELHDLEEQIALVTR